MAHLRDYIPYAGMKQWNLFQLGSRISEQGFRGRPFAHSLDLSLSFFLYLFSPWELFVTNTAKRFWEIFHAPWVNLADILMNLLG